MHFEHRFPSLNYGRPCARGHTCGVCVWACVLAARRGREMCSLWASRLAPGRGHKVCFLPNLRLAARRNHETCCLRANTLLVRGEHISCSLETAMREPHRERISCHLRADRREPHRGRIPCFLRAARREPRRERVPSLTLFFSHTTEGYQQSMPQTNVLEDDLKEDHEDVRTSVRVITIADVCTDAHIAKHAPSDPPKRVGRIQPGKNDPQ